jgi:hypothetical protein
VHVCACGKPAGRSYFNHRHRRIERHILPSGALQFPRLRLPEASSSGGSVSAAIPRPFVSLHQGKPKPSVVYLERRSNLDSGQMHGKTELWVTEVQDEISSRDPMVLRRCNPLSSDGSGKQADVQPI